MANPLLFGLGVCIALMAVVGFPAEALAGYCTSLADCTSGSQAGGTAVMVGSSAVGGLVGLVTMDGGFTADPELEVEAEDDEPPPEEDKPSLYADDAFGRMR